MEDTTNRPKWLLELENRKQKPRLAHEAGAGASCMNCNSACPGLDLHFWRKICKNCKCSRDDHDVDDDEFPQFDLLFGQSGRFKKKTTRLQVYNKKQNEGDTTFEWVPPDTSKELAMDYMKALPEEKLPIKGSAGAALRRQLLQRQLPLHDIDHKVCDELSEQEQKQFEKYLENIKKYVGQGKVMKILGARPFDRSLMTPINATDMQRYSPQHKCYVPSSSIQLRTPSSFAIKNPYARHLFEKQNKQDAIAVDDNKLPSTERYNSSLTSVSSDSNIAKSQLVEGKFYDNSQQVCDNVLTNKPGVSSKIFSSSVPMHLAEQEIIPASEMHSSSKYIPYKENIIHAEGYRGTPNSSSFLPHSETINNEAASIAEYILAEALLPPSAVHSNDIIGSTLDENRLMFIKEKLTKKYNALENSETHTAPKSSRLLDTLNRCSGIQENNKVTARADIINMKNPTGIQSEKVDPINASLQAERKTSKQPIQVMQSVVLPNNINEQYNRLLKREDTNNDSKGMESKATMESISNLLSNKHTSTNLNNPVFNLSLQNESQYLANVGPLQVELSSSILQPTIIHSEQLQNQVFPHKLVGISNESTQNVQHVEHLKDAMEDLKMDSTKAQKCQNCHEDIHIGDVVVIAEKANNTSWHPGCFICSVCNELLVDLVYFHYKNKLYCGRDLAAFLGIPRCFACDELIFVREYTVAEGHNYHVKHFCCWDCDMPLAGQKYITENDRPLCLLCYQKTYAKTCAACNIVIAADQQGVAIKNLNFHANEICFSCYSCKKNLLNGRMAIKEDKLFCSKECIAKFLNR